MGYHQSCSTCFTMAQFFQCHIIIHFALHVLQLYEIKTVRAHYYRIIKVRYDRDAPVGAVEERVGGARTVFVLVVLLRTGDFLLLDCVLVVDDFIGIAVTSVRERVVR